MSRNLRAELPDPAEPGSDGYVQSELIYPLDDRPTPQCHASTIVRTKNGDLAAAWFGGRREGHASVGIWTARLSEHEWTDPEKVVSGDELQEQEYPCGNPVLFRPDGGPLMLFYKVGPAANRWWGCLVTSGDGGRSWSEPRKLGTHQKLGDRSHLIGPVKNKPIQMKDGSILCGSSTEHNGWRIHFERMKKNDRGRWEVAEVIGPINDGDRFAAIQPAFLRLGAGKLQILSRTKQGVLATSRSTDGGNTWSELTGAGLPNPNAGADAVTLNDGRHLVVYNHSRSGRGILNVALSNDGKRWNPVLTLEDGGGRYSYPAVIQTPDGKVHCTYTYKRQSVKHVVLDPGKLE